VACLHDALCEPCPAETDDPVAYVDCYLYDLTVLEQNGGKAMFEDVPAAADNATE
jgi:hypothetical protein